MKIDLSGKTAIITGSTGGIGLAIARGLAHCGAVVVVNGLTAVAVEQAVAAVKATAPLAEVRGTAADLAVAAGFTALVKTEPACDILVNNVGIYGPQDFFDIPDSEWTRYFEINVMSGVRLSRAYMPAMLERLCRDAQRDLDQARPSECATGIPQQQPGCAGTALCQGCRLCRAPAPTE